LAIDRASVLDMSAWRIKDLFLAHPEPGFSVVAQFEIQRS